MSFLYNIFENPFARRELAKIDVPGLIVDNLKFKIRPYQEETFKRHIFIDTEDFDEKPSKPIHLLYNMATGSGKTLIMAGFLLYYYNQGYRNFLFFVNTNNIIRKTKDNFLNQQANKYLFRDKIVIDRKEVLIKEVENFEEADTENINIKFTTIQQLHIDLNNTKENSVTYEDFQSRNVILIADEAHHLSSRTRSNGDLFGSWEGTVIEILKQNYENHLLEFTATLDYESREIADKYKDKVLVRYDLAQFRNDKYSKEISLVRTQYDEQKRIIQALILNLYRQELANSNDINLKPVILFKAKRTIIESKANKERFHQLIDDLTPAMIEEIRNTSTVEIIQKAFNFFDENDIAYTEIVGRLKTNFKEENCLSANNDAEAELNQIRLNTLEDENNPIRAIFAVQKLNEGWDVLNLFDIVRLYEGRDGRAGIPGKTTISEAQLIGRGARYFPFIIEKGQDLFTRKFDDDVNNDLKILEELYYHTKEDSRYISELKKALVETGIYDDEDTVETKQLTLKPSFKNTSFYQTGKVVYNKRVPKSFENVKSITDLGVSKANIKYTLSSGIGKMTEIFKDEEEPVDSSEVKQSDIPLSSIPKHIIRYSLSTNPFYYFSNLQNFFPKLNSITDFINSSDYLGDLEITFSGPESVIEKIPNSEYLLAIQSLLSNIESEIKSNLTEYEGSVYINKFIHEVFKDKPIKVLKNTPRADGQLDVVSEPDWYVYNANYGTSEEKSFVELFSRRYDQIKTKFKNIYLVRNERALKIYDSKGRAFEPDFLLFCKQKDGEELTYQVFIEPKGDHLKDKDKWKEDFLLQIRSEGTTIKINTDNYLITGVPFYNSKGENEFNNALENTLNI